MFKLHIEKENSVVKNPLRTCSLHIIAYFPNVYNKLLINKMQYKLGSHTTK